jgi:hypothetical protein
MPIFTQNQVLKLLLQYWDELPDTTVSIRCVRGESDVITFEKDDKARKQAYQRALVEENRILREEKKNQWLQWKAQVAAEKEAKRLAKEERQKNYPARKPGRPKLDPEVLKARRLEAARIYREKNKEKLKEKLKISQQKYYEKNKEKLAKKAAERYEKKKLTLEEKKVRRKEIMKKAREKRKDQHRLEAKLYYEKNKDILREKAKEKYQENKEVLREKAKERYRTKKTVQTPENT